MLRIPLISVGKSILCVMFFCLPGKLWAQYEDPLRIYGFTQSIYMNKTVDYRIKNDAGGLPETSGGLHSDSFTLQQLNLFFTRPVAEKFTFFLNTEYTANYDTKVNSGDMRIQEAWISYRPMDEFQVKFGLLLPIFNNLNEIQNRFPLFPYIFRPIVYESFLDGLFQPSDYLPQRAFLQISGSKIISKKLLAEYAFYTGNLEAEFNATKTGTGTGTAEENFSFFQGEELSTKSMFGGRIGLKARDESFKLGFSTTRDYDFRREVSTFSLARFPIQQIPILGDVERYRFATDLSFTYGAFAFESEYIRVQHIRTPAMKSLGISLDKDFFYGNLTWNVNERSFVYGGYSFMRNKAFEYVMKNSPDYKGLNVATFGAGYKPNDYIVLKVQALSGFVGQNPYIEISTGFYTFGVSVLF